MPQPRQQGEAVVRTETELPGSETGRKCDSDPCSPRIPLGPPVEPEVKPMQATSSGPTRTSGASEAKAASSATATVPPGGSSRHGHPASLQPGLHRGRNRLFVS